MPASVPFQAAKCTGRAAGPEVWGPLLDALKVLCLAIVLILKFFFMNCVRHGYRAVMYPAPKPYSGLCFLVFAPDLFPFGLSQREQRYPARGPWPPAPPTDARVRRHTPPLQGVGVWRHAPRHTFHSRTLRFLNTEERRALLF